MAGESRSFLELPSIANLRVHTVSGAPDGDANTGNVTTLYVSPYRGNSMFLPVGGVWQRRTVPDETSVALGTSTSGRGRDLWAYASGNSIAYELGTVWASATARATGEGITWVDGIPCLESDTTRVLIASFYLTSTTVTQDTHRRRLVSNVFNLLHRKANFQNAVTSNTYTYDLTTVHQVGGNASNQMEVFSPFDDAIEIEYLARHVGYHATTSNQGQFVGIGKDSTTADSADSSTNVASALSPTPMTASIRERVSIGHHYYSLLEWASSTTAGHTFFGTNSGARKLGMYGSVLQ